MGEWKSKNHSKYLLQYHLIFVCKYRKQLLSSKSISSDIKSLSENICKKHNVIIRYMETDKDHIHKYLSKCFWKEHTFWTDGYFVCSVGNVSEKVLKEYIENQG